jgi:DNA mismatch repair protein MutS
LSAVEKGQGIVFLHTVKEGHANQSYGLQVAQLAGVPQAVIKDARQHLRRLEEHANQESAQVDLFSQAYSESESAADDETSEEIETALAVLKQLHEIQPDNLSPKEALDLLYGLKRLS